MSPASTPRTLILGGTTEASRLAAALAARGLPAILSYAGRTAAPRAQPVPVRTGGFGGAAGLAAYLRAEGIGQVIDATHPFAARISANAVAACAATGMPLLALERPEWAPGPGDRWTRVADIPTAVAALDMAPRRVFLAIGRQTLAPFAAHPHHYLLRLVDPPDGLPLPDCTVEIARGPFDPAMDRALMERYRIDLIVAKNAGGAGGEAKLIAARALGLPVILIDRPALPVRDTVSTVEEVLARLHANLGV
ncbi:cobalt-precorrin-6A reductase [Sinirhodobacter populi]|uniref:Cobalt-precorrin-6A reductase n=1 Tax=Paenirhodobacter populi TaxID=2306993 RepID=A0A443KM33_9RHOB|nr:cobalt-precorrin-6A reductase [Sinirhodobacter populi]RWR33811.1 cobalt-precorrin-6A reductase [Sinirhodobacter populi]